MNLFPAACRYGRLFGIDGNGLKLEKTGHFFFLVLMLRVPKILKKFIIVSPL